MSRPGAPSLWVNVTTLLRWTRAPVGVVRVEQEYCRWLLAHAGADTAWQLRFCYFDPSRRIFVEATHAQVAAKLAAPGSEGNAMATATPTVGKRAMQWLLQLLPEAAAARLKRAARGLPAAAARTRWRFARAEAPLFSPGDRWASLGLDWVDLDLPELRRIKAATGLTMTFICYDVIPVVCPQFVPHPPEEFESYLVNMALCADAVLCISEHARNDYARVLARAGRKAPPTHVIRLGAEIRARRPGGELAPSGFGTGPDSRPFVLFVSTIDRRKNHALLYQAWVRLRARGLVPHRLVFVGMKGWGVTELMKNLRHDARVRDDIVLLEHVSDAELSWLYRHCAFTVYPSLYEGWGLPLVESLAYGKVCLASNASSLPEAGGAWAEYLDPADVPAWEGKLGHWMSHPEEVAARNTRIAREFQPPSWDQTAEAIHRVVLTAGPSPRP